MNDLLRVKEAAAALGLSQGCLRAWIGSRRIPFVRLGRAIRIERKVIERLIAENTVPVRAPRRGR